MQRRKFLIGAGSLAAGSAAAVGTGAFTSVEADRSVSVTVAGDASAYLTMTGNGSNDDYVDVSNDEATISLDGLEDSESGKGSGVNPDATTQINNLLKIANQGTQQVELDLTTTSTDIMVGSDPAADSDKVGVYIDSVSSTDANRVDDGTADLPVGSHALVSIEVETSNGNSPDLSGTLTVEANADSTTGESVGPDTSSN